MKELSLSTTRKDEIIGITAKVEAIVADSGVKEGICLVFAPHATAAILILETDWAVEKDANQAAPDCAFRSSRNCVLSSLFGIVPKTAEYALQHDSNSGHKGGIGMFVQVIGT